MGILDDVVVNAKSAAQTVGKFAGQFVDISKLKLSLTELNSEIGKQYRALGQLTYEAAKAEDVDSTLVAEKIAAIDELYAQAAALQAQLAALQNKVTCPACGKQMEQDSLFCSKCGTKLEQPAPAEEAPAEEAVTEETKAEEEAPCCCCCGEEAPAEEKTEE